MASVTDKWAPQVPPDASIAKVAVGALNGRLDAVLNYLPRAALRPQEDAEYVHQLRVWTRRAVAALRLYEDLIPKRQLSWFRKVLRHVRRAANDALFSRRRLRFQAAATPACQGSHRNRARSAEKPALPGGFPVAMIQRDIGAAGSSRTIAQRV